MTALFLQKQKGRQQFAQPMKTAPQQRRSGSEQQNEVTGRALARKMYKAQKKKRAKAKKAAAKKQAASSSKARPAETWTRQLRGSGLYPKAVNRPVDTVKIEKLLQERDEAKAKRDYARADEISLEFQRMDVYYVDEKKHWYTRSMKTAAELEERQRKTAAKKRTRAAGGAGAAAGGSSSKKKLKRSK